MKLSLVILIRFRMCLPLNYIWKDWNPIFLVQDWSSYYINTTQGKTSYHKCNVLYRLTFLPISIYATEVNQNALRLVSIEIQKKKFQVLMLAGFIVKLFLSLCKKLVYFSTEKGQDFYELRWRRSHMNKDLSTER